MRLRAAALAFALLAGAAPAPAHDVEPLPALDYEPPAPGTYTLHRIMAAPDGEVLGLDGRPQRLARYTRERITLLGFIYTTCVDPDGCPLAYRVFDALRSTVGATPGLRDKVRLVTLSFDPVHDQFDAIAAYAERMRGKRAGADWHFITTPSKRALAPILDGLGQDLRVAIDSQAVPGTEEFTHSLKVFLIDPDGRVREIYSTGYLVPQMIVNDMKTIAAEYPRPSSAQR